MSESSMNLLAVSVGNSTTRLGRFRGRELLRSQRLMNAQQAVLLQQARSMVEELTAEADGGPAAVVVASVNEPAARGLVDALGETPGAPIYRIGLDLAIPIETALAEGATPGQDRLLNALAAYENMKQACVVVDCGTAVTVDFVDGMGVFQGGAIAPGAGMQLAALHERTAALPSIVLGRPDAGPFGKNTAEAMLNGVYFGIRGLVRILVERYAEAYEGYPPVVATGGDAALIFDDDELIDRIVPDLTLWGIEAACRRALTDDEDRVEPGRGEDA
ncbi:MAG: type III pantothenate kinase [Planctomycetota bacterium]|nr:type III pantothenate kinase [Planctomycetota bacterium]